MTNTRTRYIPEGATVAYTDANCIVYKYERNGRLIGIAYGGKRSTSDWHYNFTSVDSLNAHVANYAANLKSHSEITKARRAERHTPHTLKVGDILMCSWGYDQTNVDYYQVEVNQSSSQNAPIYVREMQAIKTYARLRDIDLSTLNK